MNFKKNLLENENMLKLAHGGGVASRLAPGTDGQEFEYSKDAMFLDISYSSATCKLFIVRVCVYLREINIKKHLGCNVLGLKVLLRYSATTCKLVFVRVCVYLGEMNVFKSIQNVDSRIRIRLSGSTS
jgi:hypothetical protein